MKIPDPNCKHCGGTGQRPLFRFCYQCECLHESKRPDSHKKDPNKNLHFDKYKYEIPKIF